MKPALRSDGMMATHFAPDMMLSGMALSGASMICFSTTLDVCRRSMSFSRRSDATTTAASDTTNATAARLLLITQLRGRKCSPMGLILERLMSPAAGKSDVGGYSLDTEEEEQGS